MSKQNKFTLLLLTMLSFFAGCSAEQKLTSDDTLTQISTLDALVNGLYDGQHSLKDVRHYGDTGIGTFQGLDGEMIMLDGQIYKVSFDGSVSTPSDTTLTPFAAMTFFKNDREIRLNSGIKMENFAENIDSQLPSANLFYAFQIVGTFKKIKTRSVARQEKPYAKLSEALKKQSLFDFENVEGVIVGLRCPSFVKGLNAPGYHMHFLTKDKRAGGHVLDLDILNAVMKIDYIPVFTMIIPESKEFYKYPFNSEAATKPAHE